MRSTSPASSSSKPRAFAGVSETCRALAALYDELSQYVPPAAITPGHLGFAVPLELRTPGGELRLMTTITSFATAVDVTVSELKLEAFLPADEATAAALTRAARQP